MPGTLFDVEDYFLEDILKWYVLHILCTFQLWLLVLLHTDTVYDNNVTMLWCRDSGKCAMLCLIYRTGLWSKEMEKLKREIPKGKEAIYLVTCRFALEEITCGTRTMQRWLWHGCCNVDARLQGDAVFSYVFM